MIKLILVSGLLCVAVALLKNGSSAGHLALRRLLAMGVLALGAVAVIFPLLTTRIANAVGVERGTDLVLYVFVIAFLGSTVSLYQRVRRLELRHNEVVRVLAIDTAMRDGEIQVESRETHGPR